MTNKKTMRLGLIGKDVSKSTSPQIHTFILDKFGYACDYEKISVSPQDFDGQMRRLLGDFDGFNVTIPYKRDVFEYLDDIVGDAFDFSAVNTVVSADKTGYNTDGAGFLQMLRYAGIEVRDKKVLVLGAGGSGRSSAYSLKKAGAKVYMYRRNQKELLEACNQLGVLPASDIEKGGYDILINCTGVGMHDTEGRSPVTESAFEGATSAVDLIYEPKESAFLQMAKRKGLQTLNGESMLFFQAYFADCLFLKRQPNTAEAIAFYNEYSTSNN